jgi:hypothetical protein
VPGKNGPEETELAAIIDLAAAKIIGIQPNRQGARVATWTWDADQLQVASVDGVTDEYQLRPVAVSVVGSGAAQRRPSGQAWFPWDQQQSSRSESRQRRHGKPKTIFDFLFGN